MSNGYLIRKEQAMMRRAATPEATAWRKRDAAARAQASKEADEKYPILTVDDVVKSRKYFEERVAELMKSPAHTE